MASEKRGACRRGSRHRAGRRERSAAVRTGEATEAAGKKVWSVRLLRAQQAVLQSQKSAQETTGVAAAFRDIRDELVNNRVDTEDRKQRLEQQLAQPLERIGEELFPEFDRRLQRLVDGLDAKLAATPVTADEDPEIVSAADSALEQVAVILLAMNDVLEDMLNLETYNELLDIVRSVVTDQERLINETKKQQKKQVLELLQ